MFDKLERIVAARRLFATAGFLASALVAGNAVVAQPTAAAPPRPTNVVTLAQIEGGSGGLSIGPQGNLYSAEFGDFLGGGSGGTRVFRITPEGETEVFAEGLRGASGNEFGKDGALYQSNIRAGKVSRISPDGTVADFAVENLVNPVGIATGKDGLLYVADCGANRIVRLDQEGDSTVFSSGGPLSCPNGITVDDQGTFYVSNFYNGDVVRITESGEASRLLTLPGNNNGHLIYHQGGLFVVGRGAHQIFRVSLDGEFEVLAGSGEKGGGDGDGAGAQFCYPNDIAVSPDGRYLYVNEVADETSSGMDLEPTRIRRIALDR